MNQQAIDILDEMIKDAVKEHNYSLIDDTETDRLAWAIDWMKEAKSRIQALWESSSELWRNICKWESGIWFPWTNEEFFDCCTNPLPLPTNK